MSTKRSRSPVRVSHLTLGVVIKRMRQGDFSVRSICEVSGLHIKTVYEMINTWTTQGLIVYVGKSKEFGPGHRHERLYSEVRQ